MTLDEKQIDEIWEELGGLDQWMKTFGYQQFARRIEEQLNKSTVPTVTMDGHQLKEALEFINPDDTTEPDQLDDELTFGVVKHIDDDGKVSNGLCCWNDDTDGVYPLHT